MIEITDTELVRVVRLCRPEAKNAMNQAMWDDTTEAFIDGAKNPSISVTILTGSGDSFSAGQDVSEMTSGIQRGKARVPGSRHPACWLPEAISLSRVNGASLSVVDIGSSYRQLQFEIPG
jgi:enoyl-CoA hydratase/carnithine racemase